MRCTICFLKVSLIVSPDVAGLIVVCMVRFYLCCEITCLFFMVWVCFGMLLVCVKLYIRVYYL